MHDSSAAGRCPSPIQPERQPPDATGAAVNERGTDRQVAWNRSQAVRAIACAFDRPTRVEGLWLDEPKGIILPGVFDAANAFIDDAAHFLLA